MLGAGLRPDDSFATVPATYILYVKRLITWVVVRTESTVLFEAHTAVKATYFPAEKYCPFLRSLDPAAFAVSKPLLK